MCTHYQALKDKDRFAKFFQVEPPASLGKWDMWPLYSGCFIRVPREIDSGDEAVPAREAIEAQWGLVPHWVKTEEDAKKRSRNLVNARSETAATLPSFRDAWAKGHRCVIPADAVFEPDWRSGKSVPTCISRSDGEPLGIAGLWTGWKSPSGTIVRSYTMLTINADEHSLMRNFHRPGDEKRMVVILPEGRYGEWLDAPVARTMEFMRPYPAERLVAFAGDVSVATRE